ncbi:hypothetical protein HPB51_022163 [Rhipicephalus microplus]|uniref:Uncharacterized protein n=1 Tax=Rhipicephalus microplus TaxID=6941 RepID=A0A9J6E3G0_RHIMP|nr:hypothetical protein HPB51_022163 [Rhipicephalus microplus]
MQRSLRCHQNRLPELVSPTRQRALLPAPLNFSTTAYKRITPCTTDAKCHRADCMPNGHRPLFLLLQETRGTCLLPGYRAFQTPTIKHKRKLPKGQAALLVRNDCPASQSDIPDLSSNARKIVAVKICPPGQKPFVAVSAYFRPGNISVGPYTWLETLKQASKNLPLLTGETSEDDNDDECIEDAFHELSSRFPAAVPHEVSADDFMEADCIVRAVASLAIEKIVAAVTGTQDAQFDSSSDEEDGSDEVLDGLDKALATHVYSAAEVAAVALVFYSSFLCRCVNVR